MSSYDGPSFFKNNHPKIKPIKGKKQPEKETKPKYELPKNVRTQNELKNDAHQYMKTPSKALPNDPPPKRYPFKNKHIPASLQKLDGWSKQPSNTTLTADIAERLQKDANTYLLFEEHLSDEMKKKLETTEKPSRDTNHEQKRQTKESAEPEDGAGKQAARIQKETYKHLMKRGTGLHRSLSNIMAEEQRGIQKSKNKLNSLFTEEKR